MPATNEPASSPTCAARQYGLAVRPFLRIVRAHERNARKRATPYHLHKGWLGAFLRDVRPEAPPVRAGLFVFQPSRSPAHSRRTTWTGTG